ncbi:hypothetical protein SERLA73DRAFT_96032 [Serpula lacrymans var. lacrymans S7.3]|uniref:DUF6830 domain-containing protein n=1 Tax=Serpula lacrymans var. lacrymans (strain S7.3) TaxID=936435 RepID=F8QA95_SERL3|nr:hypothetical protein SERLA73DRAFT_96032 [Serpula lacrymans var. lacrymans S7.3]
MQEMESDQFSYRRKDQFYYPFQDRGEWELAKFMCECLMQSQMDRFLKLEWVSSHKPSFKNKNELITWLEWLPSGPSWKHEEFHLLSYKSTPIHLIYRDALEVAQHIFANPVFAQHMMFDPKETYQGVQREFSEFMTANHAFELQECFFLNQFPEGATMMPIIMASDKTNVTRGTGNLEMHPTFLMIANIASDVRMKATAQAWRCVAFIPTPKFDVHNDFQGILQARVWHKCMDKVCVNLKIAAKVGTFIPDPFGLVRYVFTPLAVDGWQITEFQAKAKAIGLSGVQQPFWRDWHLAEPAIFLTPEILHICHKFFFDHVLLWRKTMLGNEELDDRYKSHHKRVGFRHFSKGISHVKQMTGRDHRDIQRTIVPSIAGAAPPKAVRAIRAIVDFIYIAQNPIHTPTSITQMEAALAEFYRHKQAILDAEAHRGKKGAMDHFWIPKLELLQSFARAVKNSGNILQYTADVSERLLITNCKHTFQRTSHQSDFIFQIVRLLDIAEKVRQFELYTLLRLFHQDLVNVAIRTEQDEIADLDPELAWVSQFATAAEEIRYQSPRPVRNHFLKGLTSDDSNIAFHLTVVPDIRSTSMHDAAISLNLPDLSAALYDFVKGLSIEQRRSQGSFNGRGGIDLGFDKVQLWFKFRLQQHSVFKTQVIMPSQMVQAFPPSNDAPFGNCDTILIQLKTAEMPEVAQVRTVIVPIARKGSVLHPALNQPITYIQLFEVVSSPAQQPDVDMFVVKRAFHSEPSPNGGTQRLGGFIPLTLITQAIELIPVYGERMDRTINAMNSLEVPLYFYVNNFSDKEVYRSMMRFDS